MPAKNIGIARPRGTLSTRKRIAKEKSAYLQNPNSTMNSMFNFGIISTRKIVSYKCPLNKPTNDNRSVIAKKEGTPLPPSVGQMDRLNRLKAANRSKEKGIC